MKAYQELSKEELVALQKELNAAYEDAKGKGLSLDMSRGKPGPDQLDISMGLFDVLMERIDGVPVIKIFVASGSEKPYYKTKYGLSEKGCFIRVGTAA